MCQIAKTVRNAYGEKELRLLNSITFSSDEKKRFPYRGHFCSWPRYVFAGI
jgi:hypothetical protein